MPNDTKGDPWSGVTYRGFSGGPSPAPSPARRFATRPLMIGGVAAALVLGVGFGLLMRPELIGSKPPASVAPATPPAAADLPASASPSAPMVIQHAEAPAPEPIPRAPGKLQTLPPEMAAAAKAEPRAPAVAITPAPQPAAITPPAPAETADQRPAPRYRASFDCGTARPGAEEMVCSDAALAAADRQMAGAYRRALGSGVDPNDLRQEQRDWVAIREDAARHSRHALADVYDQRIGELNEIADSAPSQ